jgi:hypothetical protein
MDYLRYTVWPYFLLGAVSVIVVGLYQGDVSFLGFKMPVSPAAEVEKLVDKLLSWFKLSSTKGLGMIIAGVIQVMITGALVGVSLYVVSGLVRIPQPGAVLSPVTRTADAFSGALQEVF